MEPVGLEFGFEQGGFNFAVGGLDFFAAHGGAGRESREDSVGEWGGVVFAVQKEMLEILIIIFLKGLEGRSTLGNKMKRILYPKRDEGSSQKLWRE
jgi:hypothetical protein